MEKVYVSIKQETGHRGFHSLLFFFLCLIIFTFISFFMRGAYNELREEVIESLRNEREVIEMNNTLKTELAGTTRARYLEFKTKERLGLKKPKEEEVVVLR